MDTAESDADRSGTDSRAPAGVTLALGLALLGYGTYMHLTIGDRTLGHCAVCDPWHPQWVVAPLIVGTGFLVVGAILAGRR